MSARARVLTIVAVAAGLAVAGTVGVTLLQTRGESTTAPGAVTKPHKGRPPLFLDFCVRGDREARSFSAFCYKQDQLVGIESVNRASDHVFGRKILGMNRSILPEQAADPAFDLKAALA